MNKAFKIRAGSTYRDTGGVLIDVDKIIKHPKYGNTLHDYDFAIIKLKTYDSLLSNTNNFVKLPVNGEETKNNETALVTGWGDTYDDNEDENHLRFIEVPVISTRSCRKYFKENSIPITDRMICAGLESGGEEKFSSFTIYY